MSINKFAVSVALAGILGASSALAENEGSFVGLNFGSASIEGTTTTTYDAGGSISATGTGTKSRFGVVYGSYAPINEEMGYRIYGFADLGDDLYNFNANADFLHTFVKFENGELRGFAGAYAGAVIYTDIKVDNKDQVFWGIDAGINAGLRVVLLKKHGIEAFYRLGVLTPETEWTSQIGGYKYKIGIKQSLTGIRYTFSF